MYACLPFHVNKKQDRLLTELVLAGFQFLRFLRFDGFAGSYDLEIASIDWIVVQVVTE